MQPFSKLHRLVTIALNALLSGSLLTADARVTLTGVLIQTLLHLDRLVWIVTASPIFYAGAWVQKGRVARVKGKKTGG